MEDPGARQAAFRCMYQAHYRAIAAYARRRLSAEDADDQVAETFLVAWRRLEDIPTGEHTRPWLYAVARRTLSQRTRSHRRRDRLVARLTTFRETAELEAGFDPGRIDDQELVRKALARLRPEDQELLRLAEWEELGRAELARAFECSANAVAIRLHRAHRRFSKALDALEEEVVTARRPEVTT
jgi:RNA polymerase sigma factor (sigma-70 family)